MKRIYKMEKKGRKSILKKFDLVTLTPDGSVRKMKRVDDVPVGWVVKTSDKSNFVWVVFGLDTAFGGAYAD